MRNLVVQTAGDADLGPLMAAIGDNAFLPDWLRRQHAGRGELLVALLSGTPVGTIYLWLEEADEVPIRSHLPGVPLLRHLRVSRQYRGRRIGTRLMTEAERRLRVLGHRQVALAVDLHNTDAARLYLRLGYQDWGLGVVHCRPLVSGNGAMDPCAVLVKELLG
jgi:GNAT superfamily N-acetyltransferase